MQQLEYFACIITECEYECKIGKVINDYLSHVGTPVLLTMVRNPIFVGNRGVRNRGVAVCAGFGTGLYVSVSLHTISQPGPAVSMTRNET